MVTVVAVRWCIIASRWGDDADTTQEDPPGGGVWKENLQKATCGLDTGCSPKGLRSRINQPGEGFWPNQFVTSSVAPVSSGLVGR